MKLTSITLLFFILSCGAIVRTVLDFKRDAIGFRSTLVWITLWLGIGFFSLFPSLVDSVMRLAQMQSRMFFILIMAVFILFALVFNLTSKLDRMERNVGKIIQELAILNYKLENNQNEEKEK